jgi:hypothetical protein
MTMAKTMAICLCNQQSYPSSRKCLDFSAHSLAKRLKTK